MMHYDFFYKFNYPFNVHASVLHVSININILHLFALHVLFYEHVVLDNVV